MKTAEIKQMPACLDIEKYVIGQLLQYNKLYHTVSSMLRPEKFYNASNRLIYAEIERLQGVCDEMTMLSFAQENNLKPNLIFNYVESMIANSSQELTYHAAKIVEYHVRRESILLSVKFNSLSNHITTDIFETIEKVQNQIDNIKNQVTASSIESIKDGIIKFQDRADAAEKEKKSSKRKIPYGFDCINNFTYGGDYVGDYVIIGGERSQGKTSFVLSDIYFAAKKYPDYKAAVISLEMSTSELTDRMIAYETQIDTKKIGSLELDENDWDSYNSTIHNLIDKQIFFVNCQSDFHTIIEHVYELRRKHGVQMIFIDYMNKIRTKEKFFADFDKFGYISAKLQDIGKAEDLVIRMGMQLNKDSDHNAPDIDRLRNGAPAADVADTVMFVFRPEAYGDKICFTGKYEHEQEQISPTGMAQIIQDKGRKSGTTSYMLKFKKELTLFSEAPEEDFHFNELSQESDF